MFFHAKPLNFLRFFLEKMPACINAAYKNPMRSSLGQPDGNCGYSGVILQIFGLLHKKFERRFAVRWLENILTNFFEKSKQIVLKNQFLI